MLNYEAYDHLPVISFGYWDETLSLWQKQGHVTADEIEDFEESEKHKAIIAKRLGFDYDWGGHVSAHTEIFPYFPETVLEVYPDGKKKVSDIYGVIVLKSDDITCIPSEINHTLKDRQTWEELYLPRLQYTTDRINYERIEFEKVADAAREQPLGIHCGSMFGEMRNWMGVEGVSYLYADDEELYTEMIDTVGNLSYRLIEEVLKSGIHFDYAHFWEDICFKNGPLVIPNVFREKVGPHYKRIADLLNEHGVNIVSLDCDGLIDSLLPIWLENGVNTMFPIEVGMGRFHKTMAREVRQRASRYWWNG